MNANTEPEARDGLQEILNRIAPGRFECVFIRR